MILDHKARSNAQRPQTSAMSADAENIVLFPSKIANHQQNE